MFYTINVSVRQTSDKIGICVVNPSFVRDCMEIIRGLEVRKGMGGYLFFFFFAEGRTSIVQFGGYVNIFTPLTY